VDIVATTWRKYGHDRTYLSDPVGHRLGWLDNRTGELTVEAEEHRAALTEWSATHRMMAEAPSAPEPATPMPVTVPEAETLEFEPTFDDLATNRPGQGVRQQAESSLAEMRERSRFLTTVARVFDVKTDERAWRKGAEGEEAVGARLERLTPLGWHVLHSIPIGERGSDIDHLLIGPGGVWTINTKNHPGKKIWVADRTVMVSGHRVPYIRNSEFEAERVRTILSRHLGWEPFVKAALVLLTGTIVPDVTVKKAPEQVLILDRMDLPRVFKKSPLRIPPEGVEQIFEIARRSSTWSAVR
jgi:hypothetical protein